MFLLREMKEDEVEEIILTEYEHHGYSVFADLSKTNYKKKVFVAENNGEILGFAIIYWNENEINIGNLFVKDKFRNKGVGKELLDFIIRESMKLGFRKIYASVPVSSKALSFYLKNGFKVEEIVKHYYGLSKHAFRISKSF